MGSGQNRQLNVPVVYLENHKNVGSYRFVQNQRQNIPKAYLKIEPNYQKIERLETINSAVVHGVVGLKNLGNTCYFNTAIHCISHTQPLVDYFLSKAYKINSSCPTSGNITKAFVSLMEQIWDDENCFAESKDFRLLVQGQKLKPYNKCINPIKLLNLLQKYSKRFALGDQEDCQELLSYLLDLLHQELNRSQPNSKSVTKDYTGEYIDPKWAADSWGEHLKINRSIIVDLFQGQLKSTCKCQECGFQSHKFEPFLFLNLPIPKQKVSIYKCLDLFQEPELLSGSCQWKCPNCKINRDFKKQIQLWKLPNQLIIHLKRFEYQHRKQVKLNTVVEFPLELDMAQYCVDQAISCYQLYAVAQHDGSSYGGHYVALCKAQNNTWYMYNDEQVFRIQDVKKMVQNEYAYMLFYQRYDNIYRQTLNKPEAWPHFRLPKISQTTHLMVQTDRKSQDSSPIQLESTPLDNQTGVISQQRSQQDIKFNSIQ
ncbi:unnamed protein product [Paramecium pentaurelia]|uniref:ubiquitinyl hydrolase 1 n=1 Tax=Paramecium pentaurelia TaxID=43138 RepID=A0A8S1VEV2_9CILI|nr:unnamed protein product [Paramecium pentaurelia]